MFGSCVGSTSSAESQMIAAGVKEKSLVRHMCIKTVKSWSKVLAFYIDAMNLEFSNKTIKLRWALNLYWHAYSLCRWEKVCHRFCTLLIKYTN